MHISGVKTAFKIADVEYVKDSTKLNFNYLKDLKDENNQSLSQNILTQNVARVYLIVVDGEIKKSVVLKQMVGLKARSIFIKMGESKGGLVLEVLACGIFFTIRYLQGLK
ncbi:hypothetical protein HMPREF1397_00596 [Helicobacter pylori GAM115Ai]|nr:hypothetical protein HMPREF1397_00596 [Helicobacter pylori GAM115Ai]